MSDTAEDLSLAKERDCGKMKNSACREACERKRGEKGPQTADCSHCLGGKSKESCAEMEGRGRRAALRPERKRSPWTPDRLRRSSLRRRVPAVPDGTRSQAPGHERKRSGERRERATAPPGYEHGTTRASNGTTRASHGTTEDTPDRMRTTAPHCVLSAAARREAEQIVAGRRRRWHICSRSQRDPSSTNKSTRSAVAEQESKRSLEDLCSTWREKTSPIFSRRRSSSGNLWERNLQSNHAKAVESECAKTGEQPERRCSDTPKTARVESFQNAGSGFGLRDRTRAVTPDRERPQTSGRPRSKPPDCARGTRHEPDQPRHVDESSSKKPAVPPPEKVTQASLLVAKSRDRPRTPVLDDICRANRERDLRKVTFAKNVELLDIQRSNPHAPSTRATRLSAQTPPATSLFTSNMSGSARLATCMNAVIPKNNAEISESVAQAKRRALDPNAVVNTVSSSKLSPNTESETVEQDTSTCEEDVDVVAPSKHFKRADVRKRSCSRNAGIAGNRKKKRVRSNTPRKINSAGKMTKIIPPKDGRKRLSLIPTRKLKAEDRNLEAKEHDEVIQDKGEESELSIDEEVAAAKLRFGDRGWGKVKSSCEEEAAIISKPPTLDKERPDASVTAEEKSKIPFAGTEGRGEFATAAVSNHHGGDSTDAEVHVPRVPSVVALRRTLSAVDEKVGIRSGAPPSYFEEADGMQRRMRDDKGVADTGRRPSRESVNRLVSASEPDADEADVPRKAASSGDTKEDAGPSEVDVKVGRNESAAPRNANEKRRHETSSADYLSDAGACVTAANNARFVEGISSRRRVNDSAHASDSAPPDIVDSSEDPKPLVCLMTVDADGGQAAEMPAELDRSGNVSLSIGDYAADFDRVTSPMEVEAGRVKKTTDSIGVHDGSDVGREESSSGVNETGEEKDAHETGRPMSLNDEHGGQLEVRPTVMDVEEAVSPVKSGDGTVGSSLLNEVHGATFTVENVHGAEESVRPADSVSKVFGSSSTQRAADEADTAALRALDVESAADLVAEHVIRDAGTSALFDHSLDDADGESGEDDGEEEDKARRARRRRRSRRRRRVDGSTRRHSSQCSDESSAGDRNFTDVSAGEEVEVRSARSGGETHHRPRHDPTEDAGGASPASTGGKRRASCEDARCRRGRVALLSPASSRRRHCQPAAAAAAAASDDDDEWEEYCDASSVCCWLAGERGQESSARWDSQLEERLPVINFVGGVRAKPLCSERGYVEQERAVAIHSCVSECGEEVANPQVLLDVPPSSSPRTVRPLARLICSVAAAPLAARRQLVSFATAVVDEKSCRVAAAADKQSPSSARKPRRSATGRRQRCSAKRRSGAGERGTTAAAVAASKASSGVAGRRDASQASSGKSGRAARVGVVAGRRAMAREILQRRLERAVGACVWDEARRRSLAREVRRLAQLTEDSRGCCSDKPPRKFSFAGAARGREVGEAPHPSSSDQGRRRSGCHAGAGAVSGGGVATCRETPCAPPASCASELEAQGAPKAERSEREVRVHEQLSAASHPRLPPAATAASAAVAARVADIASVSCGLCGERQRQGQHEKSRYRGEPLPCCKDDGQSASKIAAALVTCACPPDGQPSVQPSNQTADRQISERPSDQQISDQPSGHQPASQSPSKASGHNPGSDPSSGGSSSKPLPPAGGADGGGVGGGGGDEDRKALLLALLGGRRCQCPVSPQGDDCCACDEATPVPPADEPPAEVTAPQPPSVDPAGDQPVEVRKSEAASATSCPSDAEGVDASAAAHVVAAVVDAVVDAADAVADGDASVQVTVLIEAHVPPDGLEDSHSKSNSSVSSSTSSSSSSSASSSLRSSDGETPEQFEKARVAREPTPEHGPLPLMVPKAPCMLSGSAAVAAAALSGLAGLRAHVCGAGASRAEPGMITLAEGPCVELGDDDDDARSPSPSLTPPSSPSLQKRSLAPSRGTEGRASPAASADQEGGAGVDPKGSEHVEAVMWTTADAPQWPTSLCLPAGSGSPGTPSSAVPSQPCGPEPRATAAGPDRADKGPQHEDPADDKDDASSTPDSFVMSLDRAPEAEEEF